MIINRNVKASPERTSSETWAFIRDMLCHSSETSKAEFNKVSGILSSRIAEEDLKSFPLILLGGGPRIRVFCLHEEDALEQDANESKIEEYNFTGKWKVLFPMINDNEWVKELLAAKSTRFELYDTEEGYMGDHVAKAGTEEIQFDVVGLLNL